MNILVLVAGTNEPSNAECIAEYFTEGLKSVKGTDVQKIRLQDLSIDHFHIEHYDAETDQGKDFIAIQKAITEADGVVIASPIWNFSVPAHLKNLIDRMGSFGLDTESRSLGMLKSKPFFVLYTGGSPAVVWTGLQKKTTSHIPVSLRYFGAVVIGSHYEERCTKGKGKFGVVVDSRADTAKTLKAKGMKFAEVVKQFSETGRLPFRQEQTTSILRFAQKIKKTLGL